MLKCMGIDFRDLPDGTFDTPLGISSGAGDIFGADRRRDGSRAAHGLRKARRPTLPGPGFRSGARCRGVKEAALEIAGTTVNIGVANGLRNARVLLEKVRSGEKQFHLIEIMACPGGCVAGGGQPYRRRDTCARSGTRAPARQGALRDRSRKIHPPVAR